MSETEEIVEIENVNEISSEGARKLQSAKILPLHEATRDNARARKGRPKTVMGRDGKIVPKPTVSDLEYHAEILEEQVRFVDGYDLVQAVSSGKSSPDVLKLLRTKAARDAAALEFQRTENEKLGKDTSQLISRHTKVLREIAFLDAELRNLSTTLLDLQSPQVKRVIQLWLENVATAARETLAPEQADMFFNKFQVLMEDWEERVAEHLR